MQGNADFMSALPKSTISNAETTKESAYFYLQLGFFKDRNSNNALNFQYLIFRHLIFSTSGK